VKGKKKIEYGDFQTPPVLADEITAMLKRSGFCPTVVVEPTCGLGSFLKSCLGTFPAATSFFGFDINPAHVEHARADVVDDRDSRVEVRVQDFYSMDWRAFIHALPEPILVIGNLPWVTNAALGVVGSTNLPEKKNFQDHSGFDARTGKANFDISEWMLIKLMEALGGKKACLAILCKTGTARKALKHAWINRLPVQHAELHLIDANEHFGVSVSAGLLIVHMGKVSPSQTAVVFADLSVSRKCSRFGLVGRELVSDIDAYREVAEIDGIEYYKWRSGVKHDAAKVMEFRRSDDGYVNGLGEQWLLEDEYLYPLLKSSDLANGRLDPKRYVLLTQRRVNDDTSEIRRRAPNTWKYLIQHAQYLDRRKSTIYAQRPRFAVFGVGEYTFSPWKVAVSGLYKDIHFFFVGSAEDKPIVVDDTCYFVPCHTRDEAVFVEELLNSDPAGKFIRSLVFFDAKRPVNAGVLRRIDLKKLAECLLRVDEAQEFLPGAAFEEQGQQLMVFEKKETYRSTHAT